MDTNEALSVLLRSYKRYYDINTDDPTDPFSAEAEFHNVDKHYMFVKSANISEYQSNEYVFFYTAPDIDSDALKSISDIAWEKGISNAEMTTYHKNTDVSLIVITDRFGSADLEDTIKKSKRNISYKFGLNGYSHLSVIALELSTGKIVHNRQGHNLKKPLSNILKNNM